MTNFYDLFKIKTIATAQLRVVVVVVVVGFDWIWLGLVRLHDCLQMETSNLDSL